MSEMLPARVTTGMKPIKTVAIVGSKIAKTRKGLVSQPPFAICLC
jgi:hypothetical protein